MPRWFLVCRAEEVVRLPQSARGGGYVHHVRIARVHRDVLHPSGVVARVLLTVPLKVRIVGSKAYPAVAADHASWTVDEIRRGLLRSSGERIWKLIGPALLFLIDNLPQTIHDFRVLRAKV